MNTAAQPGYYGKIPSKGDFVSRQLPQSFIEPWDQWLQSGMAASQEKLGEQWLAFYLTSPVWRFALSHTLCSEQAWAGVIIPSVDRVGRYFPFTIAAPLGTSTPLFTLAANEDVWFAQLENLALSTLDKDTDLETLSQALDGLLMPGNTANLDDSQAQKCDEKKDYEGGQWHVKCESVTAIGNGLSTLLEQLITQRLTHFSIWWTNGSEHIEPCLLVSKDLPRPASFCALLDGQWQTQGWETQVTATKTASSAEPQVGAQSA